MATRTVRWLVGLLVLVLVFAGIFGGKLYQERKAAERAAAQGWPAAVVSVASAEAAVWDDRIRVVATLRAVQGTQISAQIAGNVTQVAFESGAAVNKGDLLVQLDDSSQRASLLSNQAKLKLADANLARARKLAPSSAISREQLQTSQRDRDVAAAVVANDRATLNKLRITAPFDGVLGIREVSLGQYVAPGTAIVDLQQLNPLLIDFTLPQEVISQLQVEQKVRFQTAAQPGEELAGKVTAIAPALDVDTRNLAVQATLDNAEGKLRPGMFGHVTLNPGTSKSGIAVPETALVFSTFGDSVYTVVEGEYGGQVAHARVVKVLAQRDSMVLLDAASLEAGTKVVTAGQNKLREGSAVAPEEEGGP